MPRMSPAPEEDFAALLGRLRERVLAGAALPAERQLAGELGVTRHQLRAIYLAPVRETEEMAVAPQWDVFALFLVVFLAGVAVTIYAMVRAATDRPALVGLGVSTPEQAAQVASFADGVIVGSALLSLLSQSPREERATRAAAFTRSLRAALDGGTL